MLHPLCSIYCTFSSSMYFFCGCHVWNKRLNHFGWYIVLSFYEHECNELFIDSFLLVAAQFTSIWCITFLQQNIYSQKMRVTERTFWLSRRATGAHLHFERRFLSVWWQCERMGSHMSDWATFMVVFKVKFLFKLIFTLRAFIFYINYIILDMSRIWTKMRMPLYR